MKYHFIFVFKYLFIFVFKYLFFLFCFRRYTELRKIAKDEYGSVRKMVEAWFVVVRTKAVNERSLQAGAFRKLWLGNESKFALVTNVIKQDLRKNGGEMKLNPAILDSGIANVQQLRQLIKSDVMYCNQAVYHLFCGGLESGKIRKLQKPEGPTSIKKLLTGAHEANLRLELYYALEKQSFGHTPSHDHSGNRAGLWREFCQLVHDDRRNNEEAATLTRRGGVPEGAEDDDDDDDDDDEDAAPPCDPKFYRD